MILVSTENLDSCGRCDDCLTHFEDDVHWAHVGFPVPVNGQHPDLDLLPGQIVQLVRLNKGGQTLGAEVQLRPVGENLDAAHVTSDLQAVRAPGAGLAVLDLQVFNI